ncbi:MAG: 4-hydroxythreonine-4-phosphate dehydrogenase PdxA, partial [Candidatus Omnitrophica bacterium]|nr:4-hydroxythreonine-4-phosphate dehydrogenase PdxA [Candidatus Omnitrophota bacterium]
MKSKIKIGISIGDPSGIGPEVTLNSLGKFKVPRDCEVFVFGDRIVLEKNGLKNNKAKFNLVNLDIIKEKEFRIGVMSERFGFASLSYLKKAMEFLKQGKINCLVTAP